MQLTCFDQLSGVTKPFSRWTGDQGASYVFSVYELEKIPAYPHAVYVVVRNRGGVAEPILIGVTTALPALFFHSERYHGALRRGGNEVHVHVPHADMCPKAVAADLYHGLSCRQNGSVPCGAT
ncbi:hypothetical protein MNBD_ALPHA09-1704, partial [hydrothermal vent metagenome]